MALFARNVVLRIDRQPSKVNPLCAQPKPADCHLRQNSGRERRRASTFCICVHGIKRRCAPDPQCRCFWLQSATSRHLNLSTRAFRTENALHRNDHLSHRERQDCRRNWRRKRADRLAIARAAPDGCAASRLSRVGPRRTYIGFESKDRDAGSRLKN
jgi:hypothetical protein